MQENIHKNPQVLQQIEWESISKILNGHTHFELNDERLVTFLDNRSEIEFKLDKTKLFTDFLYSNDFKIFSEEIMNISQSFDATSNITNIKKSLALPLKILNEFAKSCEVYLTHLRLINKYFESDIIDSEPQKFKREINKTFLNDFRKFVSSNGEVSLDKHPLIRPLYEKQLNIEQRTRGILNNLLNSSRLQNKIQFNSFDVINDRYVIPVRSDSFQSSLGMIVSRSESGNTLFVEPVEIAQLNFQRIELIIEIQSILAKIELDITNSLKPFTQELYRISQFLYECDEFIARSKFAQQLGLSYPTISNNQEIKIKNGFHPLIKNPVKNDITINTTDNGLIISGPNTGGKTATLKTLALTQLFLRYGLFVPCDYADIFLYEKVFYFGNDQQDLNSGLSSFSAEVKNYTSLFENLGESNLVLIDEIFNSTSSEEASALAIGFFKKLHEITNIHLVVSSHHQTLKTILHQDESYISAHVGFNTENNSPTYKLHYGSPGSSHALRIFNSMTKDHDLFKDVYKTSLRFIDNQVIHYEKLLESISEKEHQLNKTLLENQDLNKQLKNQKQSMEGVIKLKIQERVETTEKKLAKLMDKAEHILSQTKKGEINKHRQLDNQKASITKEINEFLPKKEIEAPNYENLTIPENVVVGKEYFCLTLQKTVLVKKIEPNKKFVHIGKGSISMKVKFSSLREANKTQSRPQNHFTGIIEKSRSTQLEYDCRGMRLEEFESLVHDITSDLMLGDVPFVTIIHGHGTGALKNWLRTYVKNNKDLRIESNDTGNDGETRIALI
jgi:DNA mismatch repair protein MutS2